MNLERHQRTDTVESAISAVGRRRAIVIIDDIAPDGDADLVFAAQHATTELVAFTVRHTSGFIRVALGERDMDRLVLGPMSLSFRVDAPTPYGISIDAADSPGTGISAKDRAHTLNVLGDPDTVAQQLTRPGHVMTFCVHNDGVFGHPGNGEAAYEITTLAERNQAAVFTSIVSETDPTRMARYHELRMFADRYTLPLISVSSMIVHRVTTGSTTHSTEQRALPLNDARCPNTAPLISNSLL